MPDYDNELKVGRPTMIFGIIILLGCAGALFIGALSAICTAAAAILAAAAVMFLKGCNKHRKVFAAAVLTVAATALVSFALVDMSQGSIIGFAGRDVTVTGRVERIEYSGASEKYTVKGEIEADGDKQKCSVVLFGSRSGEIYLFDEVELKARLYDIDTSGFNRYRECDTESGKLMLRGSIEEVLSAKAPQKTTLKMKITQLRQRICDGLMRLLPDYRGNLLAEMTVGLSGRTDCEEQNATDNFRTAGISHILVVSGMHLMIVSNAVLLVLEMLGLNRRISAAAAALFVVFYIFLAGAGVGVVRAGIMVMFGFLAILLGRRADSLTAISLAAAIIVIVKPFSLLSVSMWLSFSAALGILVFSGKMTAWLMRKLKKLPHRKTVATLIELFCVSFSAWAATLPVSIVMLGEISLCAVLVNMIIAPLLPIIMISGIAAGLLSLIDVRFFLTRLCAGIAGSLLAVIKWISEGIAKIPYAAMNVSYNFLKLWVAGSIIMLLSVLLFAPKNKSCLKIAAAASAFALVVSVGSYAFAMRDTAVIRASALENGSAVSVEYKGERFVAADVETVGDAALLNEQINSQSGSRVDALAMEYAGDLKNRVKVSERAILRIKPKNLIITENLLNDEKIADTLAEFDINGYRKAENMQITLRDGRITAKSAADGVWLISVNGLRLLYVVKDTDIMDISAADTDIDVLIIGGAELKNERKLRESVTVIAGHSVNYDGCGETTFLESGEYTVIMTENGRIF